MKLEISSTSASESEELGRKIGELLKGGEIIQLVSDLGGGKTTLTRGIVSGTGSKNIVSSPTFTVSKDYQAPNFIIKHFDFYRLQESGMVGYELSEYIEDGDAVVIIEWGGVVEDILPEDKITIELLPTGEDERLLKIAFSPKYEYVIEGLK